MPRDCDVLVVGLGPVGAILCALLAREGVSAIAVEKETDIYPLPRAAHFDHEIMRLFQKLGIAGEMQAASRPASAYEFRNAAGAVLMRYDPGAGGSPSGWAAGYMFHQPSLELALRRVATNSPQIDVRLGHTLVGFVQDAEGVTATVDGPDGPETLRAGWLVGCDGARSPVREVLGVGLSDYGFDEAWLVIDATVSDPARLPEVNLQICDPARPTTCLAMSQGRHRWEFMLLPGEQPADLLDDGAIRDLLRPWNCEDCVEIERKAVYRFHGRVADRWRDGRVLLAGDAAHQTPPFAGQGMCSGLRDVDNLAWKLAAVIRRGAQPGILDSYQTEREPQVRAVIELAIAMGRVVCISDPQQAAMRDAGMLAQRAAAAGSRTQPGWRWRRVFPPALGGRPASRRRAGRWALADYADGGEQRRPGALRQQPGTLVRTYRRRGRAGSARSIRVRRGVARKSEGRLGHGRRHADPAATLDAGSGLPAASQQRPWRSL
jgi:3-(3-hydroxy-phenyl)propionate hydroxylase